MNASLGQKARKVLASAAVAIGIGAVAAVPAQANPDIYGRVAGSSFLVVSPEGSPCGTAFLIEKGSGRALTALHVVEGGTGCTLLPASRDAQGKFRSDVDYYLEHEEELAIAARVIAADPALDLALLELESVPDGMEPLALAPSGPQKGALVFVLGNSEVNGQGVLFTWEAGKVVRNGHLEWETVDGHRGEGRVIEALVDTEGGDSGGPMVDAAGLVVGVNCRGRKSAQKAANDNGRLVASATELSDIRSFLAKAGRPGKDGDGDDEGDGRDGGDGGVTPPDADVVARVVEVSTEHGVVVNGRTGLRIHARLEIAGAEGKRLQVAALFKDGEGGFLTSEDERYRTPEGGILATFIECIPMADGVDVEVLLFVPYPVLNEALGSGRQELSYVVDVWSDADEQWVAARSVERFLVWEGGSRM